MLKTGENRKCLVCGNSFYVKRYRILDGQGNYCSKDCYHVSKIGTTGYWKGKKRPEITGVNSKVWRGGETGLMCIVCGNPYFVERGRINTAKYCSFRCYWIDKDRGLTPKNEKGRKIRKYREWRTSVFTRDGFRCQICKKVGGKLNAHHIKNYSIFKNLRYDVNNGITLCLSCHKICHFVNKNLLDKI